MMNKLIVVAALAAACSKSGGGGDAAKCNEIANGAVDRMMGAMGGMGAPPAELKTKGDALKAVIAKRCTEDKWSAEVLDCYAKASSMPDIRTCRGKLPEAQSKQLQGEEMAAMMAGGMPKPNLDEMQKRLDALSASLEAAQQELSNATDDAARTAAKDKVNQLQKQALMMRQQLERLKSMPGAAPAAPAPAPAPSAGSGSAQ